MKRFNASLFALVLFLIIALPVLASEGTAKLESTGGEMGSCFVASVYVDGRYRVLMTCRDLRSALDPVRNKYIAWAKNGENLKKIDEIEKQQHLTYLNRIKAAVVKIKVRPPARYFFIDGIKPGKKLRPIFGVGAIKACCRHPNSSSYHSAYWAVIAQTRSCEHPVSCHNYPRKRR